MQKQNGKRKRRKKGVSRRDFLTSATTGTALVAGLAGLTAPKDVPSGLGRSFFPSIASDLSLPAHDEGRGTLGVNRREILFAIGDTLIPSTPGDPGFKDLEWYGITEEVNRRLDELSDDDLELFNKSSVGPLKKKFTELSDNQRAQYFNLLLQSGSFTPESLQKKLQDIYSNTREAIFTVYYQNFPEDHWPRDANRVPLLRSGDAHQITNPNTNGMVTGWDVTGYAGPLTWEEEERRRNYFNKINWIDV